MKKALFRFAFIYFLLTIYPWFWFDKIPGVSYIEDIYFTAEQWLVVLFNSYLFHVRDTLNVDGGGSGDTSYAWAMIYTYLVLSIILSVAWTLLDRKRNRDYSKLDFILRNVVRYNIAFVAFSYGIIKLFALQMPFPNLSQLATPLGDFLPMRLSWMFMGYSVPYQAFSGLLEITTGILLLSGRTVTLGALLSVSVFANVLALNLSYDIPVKLYSMQILISCIYLVACDWRRLLNFFLLNKNAEPSRIYNVKLTKMWQRVLRMLFKCAFIILCVIIPLYDSWSRYKEAAIAEELKPIKAGLYDIEIFTRNNDTIKMSNDDKQWKDFIFDRAGMGSINSTDTLFRQRYRRGYFMYQPDTIKKTITFKKNAADSVALCEMKYKIPGENSIELTGKIRSDSVYFKLRRTDRHFQLTERQFHWVSESNR